MAAAALPNDFGGNLRNWLARVGYAMPATAPGFSFDWGQPGATSTAAQGIRFSPKWQKDVEGLSSRYGTRGAMNQSQLETLRIMLHEMLHQPLEQREPTWYGGATPDQRLWEEAAAEQSAQDLLPAAAKQLFGYHYVPGKSPYTVRESTGDRAGRQTALRQWSTLSSGSRNFQDHAARVARRNFLNASTSDRAQMLAALPAPRPKPLPAGSLRPKSTRAVLGPDRPPGR